MEKKMNESYPEKLLHVKQIIEEAGDIGEAQQYLEEFEREAEANNDLYVLVLTKILKSRTLCRQNKYERSKELAQTALEQSQQIGKKSLIVKALMALGEVYLHLGKFSQGLEIITQGERLLEKLEREEELDSTELLDDKTQLYNLKARLQTRLGEYDSALKIMMKVLDWIEQLGKRQLKVRALLNIGNIHLQKGNVEKTLESYFQGLELAESLEKKTLNYGFLFNNIGVAYRRMGDAEKALEYYQKGLQVVQELANEHTASLLMHNIGNVYQMKGEVQLALKYYEQALAIREKFGNPEEMGMTLHDIGSVYSSKGELDRAIKYIERSLEFREEVGNKFELIQSLSGAGKVYQRKGDYEKAYEFYQKALMLSRTEENPLIKSDALSSFIDILIEKRELSLAEHYLEELKNLSEKTEENKIIGTYYKISKALLLKTGRKTSEPLNFQLLFETLDRIVKAQEILGEIIEEDIEQNITIEAIFNLCELFILELKVLGREEMITEVNQLTDKLENIGKEQNSFSLLAKTYLFQAHLALLQGEQEQAKDLLRQARAIAEEKGYEPLAAVIRKEQQRLEGVLPKWKKEGKDLPLLERMEHLQLEGLILSLRQNRVEFFTGGKPTEKPTMNELFAFADTLKKREINW